MLIFTDLNELRFKFLTKPKRKSLYSSIYPKNFKISLKQINYLSDIFPNSPTNIPNNNSNQKKNNTYNNNFSLKLFTYEKERNIMSRNLKNQLKLINYLTEKLKTENKIIRNKIEFNTLSKNQKSFYPIKENYNNLTNKFSNKQVDIDKFIEEINSFLLPNDKTFENIQNLINDKIKNNKETPKIEPFNELLMSKDIPINTFNYELIFRYIFNNTFKEALKKALLNKTFINKDDIKEEYQKQINDIKLNLNLHNKEIENINNNQNFKSTIKNNSSALITYINNSKLESNNYISTKSERHKRNRIIIQTNSSNDIFFNQEKFSKLYENKIICNNSKIKELNKKYCNNLNYKLCNKTLYGNYFQIGILKTKTNNVKDSRLKNIIKKQKIIIENNLKLRKNKNEKDNSLINKENSVKKNIKVFDFLSNKKLYNNNNKNEDIIDYLNINKIRIKIENKFKKGN